MRTGQLVNLERAMRADARFGGHFVQGHVDGTGLVTAVRDEAESHWVTVSFDRALAAYCIPKGSIAVDGVSLTIAALRDHEFDVMIIPFTWQHTNIHGRRPGDRVNLECDIVGKYVARAAKSTKRPKIRMAKRRTPFATIEEAIDAIRAGRMVVVVDDEDRENEGDLTIAAEKITPDVINFMATHGRGLICMPMTGERLDELELPLMVNQNTTPFKTAFCVSIEAKHSVSTGISASDRAKTVLAAIDPKTKPSDLARPGHMFPLRARAGGVMVRAGQTEAAVDLARIAGLYPAGVICEIMNPDGTMARVPELT
jgi:3,4-dihydroxy-2-butanone 4-phosphate synthase